MKQVPIGTTVVIEAPGSRGDNGATRMIPAVVLQQWPDSSVDLYALHFEGAPILMRGVTLDRVRMVGQAEPVEKPRTFSVT
jgi:hypothetical protein